VVFRDWVVASAVVMVEGLAGVLVEVGAEAGVEAVVAERVVVGWVALLVVEEPVVVVESEAAGTVVGLPPVVEFPHRRPSSP